MDGEEYYIYFFIKSNEDKNLLFPLAEKTNFIQKDLDNTEIELYIFKSKDISNDFNKYKDFISNKKQKAIFLLDFDNEINIENNLLKISYIVDYLKQNNNNLHLKDLINFINPKYEIDLKYKKNFIKIINSLDNLDLLILLFKNKNIENIITLLK